MRPVFPAPNTCKYVPSHARPARVPTIATTAGLTLSLMPAVLAATSSPSAAATPVTAATSASAAATTVRTPTHLAISELGRVSNGRATVTTALISKDRRQYFPRQKVHFQVFYAKQWRTVAAANTDARGIAKIAVPLNGAKQVRSYFPGQATLRGAVSRPVTVGGLTLGQRAIVEAAKHYGKAYRYGATGPNNFDCSGFTSYVYRQLGKTIPRTSRDQARALRRVPVGQKQIGDLIFTYTSGRVTHVGIYAGNNKMWASPKTGDHVKLQSLFSRNITVGRVS